MPIREPLVASLTGATEGFVSCAIRATSLVARRCVFAATNGSATIALYVNTDGSLTLDKSDGTSTTTSAGLIVVDTEYVISAGWDGANGHIRIDGSDTTGTLGGWFSSIAGMDELTVSNSAEAMEGYITRPVIGTSWDAGTVAAVEGEINDYLAGA
jgi:hypothetical protein